MSKISKCVDDWHNEHGEIEEVEELKKSLHKVIEDEIDSYFETEDLFYRRVNENPFMQSCNKDIQIDLINRLLNKELK